jgi:hypothetical protein
MAKRKKTQLWAVEVEGKTSDLYTGIEAESQEAAEKIGLEMFKDDHGDRFDHIGADAEEDCE